MELLKMSYIEQWRLIITTWLNLENNEVISFQADNLTQFRLAVFSDKRQVYAEFIFDKNKLVDIRIYVAPFVGNRIFIGNLRIGYFEELGEIKGYVHEFLRPRSGINIENLKSFLQSLKSVLESVGYSIDEQKVKLLSQEKINE